jgi:hypothetical protein
MRRGNEIGRRQGYGRPDHWPAEASAKAGGLFDIVRWDYSERFSDEPQFGTRSPVLILRSAPAPTAPQILRGVRASRSMRARGHGAFWRNEPNCHFGQTKPRSGAERRANLRLWETIAGFGMPVSGLLFTGSAATPTCRAVSARSGVSHFVDARRAHLKVGLGGDSILNEGQGPKGAT